MLGGHPFSIHFCLLVMASPLSLLIGRVESHESIEFAHWEAAEDISCTMRICAMFPLPNQCEYRQQGSLEGHFFTKQQTSNHCYAQNPKNM